MQSEFFASCISKKSLGKWHKVVRCRNLGQGRDLKSLHFSWSELGQSELRLLVTSLSLTLS